MFEEVDSAIRARASIVDALMGEKEPLAALRKAMRRHAFGGHNLQPVVAELDSRSRKEGLHLIQAWDFNAQRFSDESIPVLLLDYCARLERRAGGEREAVALLLDQYFINVLSLLAVRAWDDGDANANLDRVDALLKRLQESGNAFIDDAESLLFVAISYFHPEESAYTQLLEKVERLDAAHQLRMAHACAAMMSAHFRWGLRFMYQRDVGRMRDDNVIDYPWLTHAVRTLAREYAARPTDAVLDSLLVGVAGDPWKYVDEVRSLRDALLSGCEAFGRSGEYSPFSFTTNFPVNAAVASVAVALEDGGPAKSLSVLFRRHSNGAAVAAQAERLMKYAASDPGRLGAGGAPLVVHDPREGISALNNLMRLLSS